jgi:hypothetical protein
VGEGEDGELDAQAFAKFVVHGGLQVFPAAGSLLDKRNRC